MVHSIIFTPSINNFLLNLTIHNFIFKILHKLKGTALVTDLLTRERGATLVSYPQQYEWKY